MNNLIHFLAGVIWGLNILIAPVAVDKEFNNQVLIIERGTEK